MENQITDFQPREYQIELFEKALKENTIIFLPTGSGKTFIAIMLIKHKSNDLKLPYSEGGKRTFFIVDTVALVAQQAKSIEQQTPLSVGAYSGDMGVDFWDLSKWLEELEKHQVLVMTAAIFLDMILHEFVSLYQVNLLVIDECHHAVNKHPMRQIMEQFEGIEKKFRPRILGLTAALLNSNVKPNRIEKEIHDLEITLQAKIARAKNEAMIQVFSTNPKEEIVYFDSCYEDVCLAVINSSFEELDSILNLVVLQDKFIKPPSAPLNAELIITKSDPINEIKNILKEIVIVTKELGGYASSYALLSRMVHLERMRISTSDPVLINVLGQVITQFLLIRKKFDLIMTKGNERIIKYSSPKLKELFKILKDYEDNNIALVFVERRITAKVLYYIFGDLADCAKEYVNIKPDFIVGFNSNPAHLTREQILERKKNDKTLKKFNEGETNVLFASDVIEEGIDVRNCNFVIKFDQPKTVRSYIQSKGRARKQNSKYIVLAPRQTTDMFAKTFSSFKAAEGTLKETLCCGRDSLRIGGTEKEAQEFLYSREVEPFCVDSLSGAKVTIASSVSLLNRYCNSLPSDKFTKLTVFYWKKNVVVDGKNKILGYLQLPVNSPIRSIVEGHPCETFEAAKGAVSLEACKKLFELGELDSHLLPSGNKINSESENVQFPLWELFKEELSFKAGTKKCRRIYDKNIPNWICESLPVEDKPAYLHVLKITPNYSKPDSQQHRLLAFYNLLQSDKNFAVITSKKWPKICNFPLFMNVGEVSVTVQQNARKVMLCKEQIKLIFEFHCLLFTQAWTFKKNFLVKDYENKENSYLVVPTIIDDGDDVQIDWETIKNHKCIPTVKSVPIESRGHITVDKEKYFNKIVIPWYRPKGDTLKYVVTRVCEEETPLSEFPSKKYDSYADYFLERYNQSILNKNQKLIEVRAISGMSNHLLPRGRYKIGKKRRRDEEDLEETLVPELCLLLEFPAVYMLKVTLLPSLLHRITMLLNAEELRQKIAFETGLGVVKLPQGVYWNSMEVDNNVLAFDENSSARSTIEVSNMLTEKMVELQPREYGWKKEEEPMDIERNIRNVDLLSVLHYEKFVKMEYSPIDKSSNISLPPCVDAPDIPILRIKNSPYGPQLSEVVKALVASSANDIINYERLETLGDSYLKFLVSLVLFVYLENKDEGKLTHIKGKIIGNQNLYYCGKNINLGKILKVYDFSPDDWDVPGFVILGSIKEIIKKANIPPSILYQISLSNEERDSSILSEETRIRIQEIFCNAVSADESAHNSLGIIGQHNINDKVIADSIEALVGVYLEANGIEGAFKLCKWLKILPENLDDINQVLYQLPPTAQVLNCGNINEALIMPDIIESILGYKFKDRSYLLQALTHCSFNNDNTDCYQRLEFLGDAILDFLITSYIYSKCKNITPGELTDLRSALVNNVTFACLTVRYGFHKFMLIKACKLTTIINRFVEHQDKRGHKIGAEILFLLNESDVEAAEVVDVPKALGDLFESLAAAIYLDSGKSLDVVWNIFYKLMHNEIEEFMKNVPKNSIRLLYEKFPNPLPTFGKPRKLNEGPAVMIPLTVYQNKEMTFVGVGENKNQAKLAAAKVALRHFHFKDPL